MLVEQCAVRVGALLVLECRVGAKGAVAVWCQCCGPRCSFLCWTKSAIVVGVVYEQRPLVVGAKG